MSDNPLCAEINRLRTVLAANKRLLPNEKLVVGNRPRGCLECGAFTHFEWYGIAFCSLDCLALGIRQKLNAIKTPTTTPAEQMWAYTEGKLDELIERARELEGQLAEAQASCAVMRKVLDEVQELEIVEHRPACSDYNRVTISCECGYRDWLAKAEEADTTDAGKAMLERMKLLEELVLLTARVGDWAHADRTPSNEELRRAIETVKGMLKEVSDDSAD